MNRLLAETNGTRETKVVRDGDYEFAFRRYPVEAALPILGSVPVPEALREFYYFNRKDNYAETHQRSRALQVVSVMLTIGRVGME